MEPNPLVNLVSRTSVISTVGMFCSCAIVIDAKSSSLTTASGFSFLIIFEEMFLQKNVF